MSATEQVNQVRTAFKLIILVYSRLASGLFSCLRSWKISEAPDSPGSSTGRDQLILACKVAWVCWESSVPPTGAACMNNERRDCRYIIMLYGALNCQLWVYIISG